MFTPAMTICPFRATRLLRWLRSSNIDGLIVS